jgi:hypothetical protein
MTRINVKDQELKLAAKVMSFKSRTKDAESKTNPKRVVLL